MREVQPGPWWWEAEHPEWTRDDAATEDSGPEVSSYAIDDGERLVDFPFVGIFRVEDGKIRSIRIYLDQVEVFELGLMPGARSS